jgi:hypothetical protein
METKVSDQQGLKPAFHNDPFKQAMLQRRLVLPIRAIHKNPQQIPHKSNRLLIARTLLVQIKLLHNKAATALPRSDPPKELRPLPSTLATGACADRKPSQTHVEGVCGITEKCRQKQLDQGYLV